MRGLHEAAVSDLGWDVFPVAGLTVKTKQALHRIADAPKEGRLAMSATSSGAPAAADAADVASGLRSSRPLALACSASSAPSSFSMTSSSSSPHQLATSSASAQSGGGARRERTIDCAYVRDRGTVGRRGEGDQPIRE
jgi:hypothetical protein